MHRPHASESEAIRRTCVYWVACSNNQSQRQRSKAASGHAARHEGTDIESFRHEWSGPRDCAFANDLGEFKGVRSQTWWQRAWVLGYRVLYASLPFAKPTRHKAKNTTEENKKTELRTKKKLLKVFVKWVRRDHLSSS